MSMTFVEIQNQNRALPRPIYAKYCNTFFCQLRGLMFRRQLAADEGLLLVQKRATRAEAAIHMLFMFMDLAVVWLDEQHRVVDVRLARRWRPAYLPQKPAQYILELSADHLDDFQVGDQLEIHETHRI